MVPAGGQMPRVGDPGEWIFPDELPRFLGFAGDRAIFVDGGFAEEVELIGGQQRGDAEQFAVDELVQEQLRFHAGDGGRIVFGRQSMRAVNDAGFLVPGFAVERGLVRAPRSIGAERQPDAAFAAAFVLLL